MFWVLSKIFETAALVDDRDFVPRLLRFRIGREFSTVLILDRRLGRFDFDLLLHCIARSVGRCSSARISGRIRFVCGDCGRCFGSFLRRL